MGADGRCGQSTRLRSLPNRQRMPSFIALRSPRIRCGVVFSAIAWRGSYRDMTRNLSFSRHMAMADTDDPLAQALYTDIKTWLPGDILTKVDRASMANSLEVRAPFLDHQFVEWAATLPSDLKLHRGTSKYILKRALEPLLPPRDPLPAKARVFDADYPAGFEVRLRARLRSAIESHHVARHGILQTRANWSGWSTIMSGAGKTTRRSFGWCWFFRLFLRPC